MGNLEVKIDMQVSKGNYDALLGVDWILGNGVNISMDPPHLSYVLAPGQRKRVPIHNPLSGAYLFDVQRDVSTRDESPTEETNVPLQDRGEDRKLRPEIFDTLQAFSPST